MMNRREVLRPFEEHKEYMEERIQTGIELYRKGFADLSIVDKNGNPVENVQVELRQTKHDFLYGANIFMLDELPTEEANQNYKDRYAEIFNEATIPFYWMDNEPEQGTPRYDKDSPKIYRRPAIDLCLEYCEERGITPKAHCLNYDPFSANWLPRDVPQQKFYLEKRFRELSERYANRNHGWEVTNETIFRPNDGSTPFALEPDLVNWSFKTAERFFSSNELIINDGTANIWPSFNGTRSNYYLQIKDELRQDSRIDTIGMQFHMFYPREDELKETASCYDPQRIYRVLDRYADFGKPIQITESTIPAYSNDPEDEAIQAEIIDYLYSMWFSHPNVEAIIYWNLIDGYAAFAPQGDMTSGENYYHGGLLRYDGSPKPAFYKIKELFGERWRTNLSLKSDSGSLKFKGFYGEYDVTITANGKTTHHTFHLGQKALNKFRIVIE